MSQDSGYEHDREAELDSAPDALGMTDLLGFLYRNRARLFRRFLVLAGVSLVMFLIWHFALGKTVRGTLALTFRGIEKHEYPNGRKFSVEDFRSPAVLGRALTDAGLKDKAISTSDLAARIYVTPIIPPEIRSRWQKQDADGVKREDYYPSQFDLEIAYRGLSDDQQMRLFDAIVAGYQEQVKFQQESALGFIAIPDRMNYEKLIEAYDLWDVPSIYRATYTRLDSQLKDLIIESLHFQDPAFHLAFLEIQQDLQNWFNTRFLALEGLTYEGLLVRDPDLIGKRSRYQIQDLDILIRQRIRESEEAGKLLDALERPKAVLAGQLMGKEGVPLVDASALDRLVKSDYVGPLVQRISKLQEDIQAMEVAKARLDTQLALLPKSSNVSTQTLPERYRVTVGAVSSELTSLIRKYNQLLDDYLSASVSSFVYVKQSPVVTRKGYSTVKLLTILLLLSLLLTPFVVVMEVLWERARVSSDS
jgi:hypothetical protein